MDQRTCSNCKHIGFYDDGYSCDLYCTKHEDWVVHDGTCDDWVEEQ